MKTLSVTGVAILRHMLKEPEEETYGGQLARVTGYGTGSITPALHLLLERKWLTDRRETWEEGYDGQSPRRYFKLTAEGIEQGKAVVADVDSRLGLDRQLQTKSYEEVARVFLETFHGMIITQGMCSPLDPPARWNDLPHSRRRILAETFRVLADRNILAVRS